MVDEFLVEYAKLIVEYPDDVKITSQQDGDLVNIVMFTNRSDVGKLIGKEGRMIGALKTIISGCKAKNNFNYRINIESL